MEPWNDSNRFNQSGYSTPTVFPIAKNYENIVLYLEDYSKAIIRQESHLEWLWEEREEARIAYLVEQTEIKAEREEYYGY